jgi:hypothetical protein
MSPYDLFVCRATIKALSATSQGHFGTRMIRSRTLSVRDIPDALVVRRFLHLIDDEELARTLGRFEFSPSCPRAETIDGSAASEALGSVANLKNQSERWCRSTTVTQRTKQLRYEAHLANNIFLR